MTDPRFTQLSTNPSAPPNGTDTAGNTGPTQSAGLVAGFTADVTDLLYEPASAPNTPNRPSLDVTTHPEQADSRLTLTSPPTPGLSAGPGSGEPAGEPADGVGSRVPRTYRGARALDRALAEEAAADAAVRRSGAREAAELSALRVAEARAEARDRARQREQWRRDSDRAARRRRRAEHLGRLTAAGRERRAMAVVVPMMLVSGLVAWSAQFHAYQAATGSTWAAGAIAAMVEGGTWLGAALESIAIERRRPARRYRALTWFAAGVAAVVNLAHGVHQAGGGWTLGITYGCASLWGVTAWTAYVGLRTDILAGYHTAGRRAAWRQWLRYPRMSWRTLSLRLAAGAGLDREDAWRQVWAARRRHPRWMGDTMRPTPSTGHAGPADPSGPTPTTDPIHPPDSIHPPDPIGGTDRIGGADRIGEADPFRGADLLQQRLGPPLEAGGSDRSGLPVRSIGLGGSARRATGRRSLPQLETELREAIGAGRLPAQPTADAIRIALRVGPKRARHLRDIARATSELHPDRGRR